MEALRKAELERCLGRIGFTAVASGVAAVIGLGAYFTRSVLIRWKIVMVWDQRVGGSNPLAPTMDLALRAGRGFQRVVKAVAPFFFFSVKYWPVVRKADLMRVA